MEPELMNIPDDNEAAELTLVCPDAGPDIRDSLERGLSMSSTAYVSLGAVRPGAC